MTTASTSTAAIAWLCRLASGFAAGSELIAFLADDRHADGRARWEASPTADALLREWMDAGIIVRGRVQRLTPEQAINYGGSPGAYPAAYGYTPGPHYRAPRPWVAPPSRPPTEPRWIQAARERSELGLDALAGTRDAEGFLLFVCPGGGPCGSSGTEPAEGSATCRSCHERHPLRADGYLRGHVARDWSSRQHRE